MQVNVMVTTAGGIEEDLIKCLAPTFKGDFSLPGVTLRSKGLNRIGNLLVPNDNYCKFEDWIMPIFDKMLEEQSSEVFLRFKYDTFAMSTIASNSKVTCSVFSHENWLSMIQVRLY